MFSSKRTIFYPVNSRNLWLILLNKIWLFFKFSQTIDIERLQNRLLKVCYVPATSAQSFKASFSVVAINSTNEANKAGGMCL
jgi:hypothetical protein